MLVRSDLVSPLMVLLLLVLAALLLWHVRLAVIALGFGLLWGLGSLLVDAAGVSVDDSWLATHEVSAEVIGIRQQQGYQRLLLDRVERSDGLQLSGRALVYLYGGRRDRSLMPGERIRLTAAWHQPRNYANPGRFNYRAWCFDRHVALIGSARSTVERIGGAPSMLARARLRIETAVGSAPESSQGVLHALLLGDRHQVSQQVERHFSATGTAHLLAISGMHVGMVAGWGALLLWWLLTRREAWIVRWPARQLALVGGAMAAALYAMLAGWPLPAIRAMLMLGAGVLAWQLRASSRPMNLLLAALGLILLFDPAAITSLSLWLSFLATAGILLWGGEQGRGAGGFRQAVSVLLWVSLLAALVTLPIVVDAFGRLPVYALPANLVLIPLYGGMVLPVALIGEGAALLGLDQLAGLMMWMSGRIVELGLWWLATVAELPAGTTWTVRPPLWLGLLYAAGMLGAGVMWLRRFRRSATITAALVLMLYCGVVLHESDRDRPMWVAWDVGQGAASSLLLPGRRVVVVDLPGRDGSRFNGGTIVADGLRAEGFRHVDLLVLTHAQFDHMGGAGSLLASLDHVGALWLPDVPSVRRDPQLLSLLEVASYCGTEVRWLGAGERLDAFGVNWQVLWPPHGYDPANSNDTSLVLRAEVAGRAILFPGDIESPAERGIVAAGLVPVSLMLMPHHGSRSSSDRVFVERLAPELAVAQTGVDNRYGFPASEVVGRYVAAGARVVNTAAGAVMVEWPDAQHPLQIRQWHVGRQSRRDLAASIMRSVSGGGPDL